MFRTKGSHRVLLAGLALFGLWSTPGITDSRREFRLRDDCDPATFGPNCIGDGDTTLDEFLAELTEDHSVGSWKMNPDKTKIDAGEHVIVVNRGGLRHTFTKVARFGGGFVATLNTLSGNPVPAPECATVGPDGKLIPQPPSDTNLVVPAQTQAPGPALPTGVTRFQCCIHPWMRSTVTVRSR